MSVAVPESDSANMPKPKRKFHSKSKKGCQMCKKRHIKVCWRWQTVSPNLDKPCPLLTVNASHLVRRERPTMCQLCDTKVSLHLRTGAWYRELPGWHIKPPSWKRKRKRKRDTVKFPARVHCRARDGTVAPLE